jgi:hypothetical protein
MDEQSIRQSQALLELLYAARDQAALRRYAEDKTVAPAVRNYAAGLLLRPWLPWGARRQALMFVFIVGAIGLSLAFASFLPLLLLVIAASFSPRLVGETLLIIGRLRQGS